ncbi:MAG TPA: deoxyhypusine synthase [Thermoplasmatales archaeon]|nr:deoxyhypusine synthase [Thermoplasmatales archaeon]
MHPVRDIEVGETQTADRLVRQMYEAGGFTAKKVAEGVDLLESMVREDYTVALSFPACITATGTRGVIREMVKRNLVDCIITTCGTLDHDLARVWRDYHHGSFEMDDVELHRRGVNRLGNVLVPTDSYGTIIEEKMQDWLADMGAERDTWSSRQLCAQLGRRLDESSILYWAWKNQVPVFIPGITDGAVGSQIWLYAQSHPFHLDVLQDEQDLADLFFREEGKMGALIVGGGIAKHHLIWWSQFRGGLDSAVYVTSAPEWDGSLSGARLREGISWGKLRETARQVTIEGDATVLLPLMAAALLERLSVR